MMVFLPNGTVKISDVNFSLKCLILSGDNDKNLLLTVEVREKLKLDKPATLSPDIFKKLKLLSEGEVITPDDLANSGLFKIERIINFGVPCVRFGFGQSDEDGILITVFIKDSDFALANMHEAGIV